MSDAKTRGSRRRALSGDLHDQRAHYQSLVREGKVTQDQAHVRALLGDDLARAGVWVQCTNAHNCARYGGSGLHPYNLECLDEPDPFTLSLLHYLKRLQPPKDVTWSCGCYNGRRMTKSMCGDLGPCPACKGKQLRIPTKHEIQLWYTIKIIVHCARRILPEWKLRVGCSNPRIEHGCAAYMQCSQCLPVWDALWRAEDWLRAPSSKTQLACPRPTHAVPQDEIWWYSLGWAINLKPEQAQNLLKNIVECVREKSYIDIRKETLEVLEPHLGDWS